MLLLDWFVDLSDEKLSDKKLSDNKLFDNRQVDWWEIGVFFKPITIEEIVIFMIKFVSVHFSVTTRWKSNFINDKR